MATSGGDRGGAGCRGGDGRVTVKAEAGQCRYTGWGGLAVGSLFHGMQTLTHTLKELKNTLNHEVSIPLSPPETQKNAWLIQEPPPWNKAAVWARGWGGVGAASFLSRGKAQRQGRGPRQGGSTLTAIGSGCANQGPSQSLP